MTAPTSAAETDAPETDAGADPLAGIVADAVGIDSIEDGRARLDEIDAQIRDLVRARRAISAQVQHLRRSAGGPRIEHARENEILSRYGDALGRPGVSLALAILEICRGVPSQR